MADARRQLVGYWCWAAMPTTTTRAPRRSTGARTKRLALVVTPLLWLGVAGGCGETHGQRVGTTPPDGVAAPTTTVATAAGRYRATGILRNTRFAVPPIVLYTRIEGRGSGYSVYARLTRDLPRDRTGGVNGFFNITSNPDAVEGNPILNGSGRRAHCFEQAIGWLQSRRTPTGRGAAVDLTLTVNDRHHRRGTLTTTVRLSTRKVRGNVDDGGYPARVGC